MSSFLHRMAERAQGKASVVQPLVPPRYASPELGPDAAPVMDEEDDAPPRAGAPPPAASAEPPRAEAPPPATSAEPPLLPPSPAIEPRIQRAPAVATAPRAAPDSRGGTPAAGFEGRRGPPDRDDEPFAGARGPQVDAGPGAPSDRTGAGGLLMGAARASPGLSEGSPAGAGTLDRGVAGPFADRESPAALAGAGRPPGAPEPRGEPLLLPRLEVPEPRGEPLLLPQLEVPEPRGESLLLPQLEVPEPLVPPQEGRAPAPAQAAASTGERTIRITIGRVDVRAAPPPASPRGPAAERKPPLSLEDYLASRQRRSR